MGLWINKMKRLAKKHIYLGHEHRQSGEVRRKVEEAGPRWNRGRKWRATITVKKIKGKDI